MSAFAGPHKDSKGESSSIETEKSRIFDETLFATLDAFQTRSIEYALIGGVAAFTHGRPRGTQDIDIFVRPEDAENALDILEEFGFRTERTFATWLFKAFKNEVLVDIIFRSEGNIYFDEEMNRKSVIVNYHGRPVRVVSPEDFVLIKAAAHKEDGAQHWHDALAALAQSKLDWIYLLSRARKAPRRLLSLLVYAQSADIWIPNDVVQRLFKFIFEGSSGLEETVRSQKPLQSDISTNRAPENSDRRNTYLAAAIREAIAQSETTGALDIDIYVREDTVLIRGQVPSENQKMAILDLVFEIAPHLRIENQMHVMRHDPPNEVEALQ